MNKKVTRRNSRKLIDSTTKGRENKDGAIPEENPETHSVSSATNKSPATPVTLLSLCQKGEWFAVEHHLKHLEKDHPEINQADQDNGLTPLMLSTIENKISVAERLTELGANLNSQAKDGRSALHFAAVSTKDEVLKMLVSKKADPMVPGGPQGQLPIHMACSKVTGLQSTVSVLLKAMKKDVFNIRDLDGNTILFLAADAGSTIICRELIAQGGISQLTAKKKVSEDTALHLACFKSNPEIVRILVEAGTPVNIQNAEGQTALHIAARDGDESMLKVLFHLKADPNIGNKLEKTPLHLAAERGNIEAVDMIIDKFKANISARAKDGSTLMHIACYSGHYNTALSFLRRGVPLNMPNKLGAVGLHIAAMKGHTAVVKCLLQKGASVDTVTKDGYTALHLAVRHVKPQVVQTLLGSGACVDIKGGKLKETPLHLAAETKGGEKCAEMLLKSGADANSICENGETALHIAARYGFLEIIKALLEEDANPTKQSKTGESPLHIAVRHCHKSVAAELLKFVKEKNSRNDAVALVNQPQLEGETPIHLATEITKNMIHAEFEDTDMIKLLLEYDGKTDVAAKLTEETPFHCCARAGNADIFLEIVKHAHPALLRSAVNKQTRNGWSPLLVASEKGNANIVRILLQNHARVDVFDEHGKAALHLAAENGHEQVADLLLRHKAFVNAKSKLGITPLHLAAQNGFSKLVRLLIETHGAAIDALTLDKRTPLHMAAEKGQIDVCNSLIKMNADANATDSHSQNPLHLAAKHDHSDVVKLFLKHKPELVSKANCVYKFLPAGDSSHIPKSTPPPKTFSFTFSLAGNGMTCAHIAAERGSVAVIKELKKFNKSVITTATNRLTGYTPLHMAAAGGHKELVLTLLEAGALATDETSDGSTPLHLAARYGHVHILEALRGHISLKTTSMKTGLTALHIAAHYAQISCVQDMLNMVPATVTSEMPYTDTGVKDVNAEYGLTPLHLASQSGHEGLVRLLLNSQGVQPDAATNLHGSIPLHLAAKSGHTAIVSLLLSKSTAQVHRLDKMKRSALHMAAGNGHINMVGLLLGQGADINACDMNNWTALHYAAKGGYLKVVKLLVESGASTNVTSSEGKVPMAFAASYSHTQVLSYLMHKDYDTQQLMEDKKFIFDLMVCGKLKNNECLEEFILTSKAPMDTAVKLCKNFHIIATKEKERMKDLVSAGNYCESIAFDLLTIASSGNNTEDILKAVDNKGTIFLDILIENEQKAVVAHPAVQQYLSDIWMGSLKWSSWKITLLFVMCVIIPPVWFFLSLPLKHKYNRVPIIKFMTYLVSHLYLMILFSLTVVFPPIPVYQDPSLIPRWYEWLLLTWLSGMLVLELTNPGDRTGLGWIRLIIIGISAIGFFCHILAIFLTNSGENLAEALYIRNQFLAFCLLLTFVQLLEFFSFHHLFGPWGVIIHDLIKDLVRFLVILLLFMVGFSLHLVAIYQPVRPITNSSNHTVSNPDVKLLNPLDTFELLFFSLFGLVDRGNLPPLNRSPSYVTKLVNVVFGIYMMVTLIVLINLLIAMMSDTYQRIQSQSDTEWKFGRAKLIRNMNKKSSAPSPLNLFTKFFTYCQAIYKHRGKMCAVNVQEYINDNEITGGESRPRFNKITEESSWISGLKKRKNQVSPEEFVVPVNSNKTMTIEEVIDWKLVNKKYMVMRGIYVEEADEKD